jgi:hypothetical protein
MANDIDFPPWRPDITNLGTNAAQNVSNVVPRADGWGPIPSFAELTQALPGPCCGYFYARNSDSSVALFAATSTNLYLLNNSTFAWSNVSAGGGPYSALSATAQWQFAQFGTIVLATQANVALQNYDLSSASAFSALSGSPPQAAFIKIISRFVILAGLANNPNRVQWSDLDNITEWTAGVGQSDFQDEPEGGAVVGIAGGETYGIIFQNTKIRTLTYNPGSPEVFDILSFPAEDGLYASYSVVEANNSIYFISPQGFKTIPYGGIPTPIGKEQVDRTFFGLVDASNLQLCIGAADPTQNRVLWSFKSNSGSPGQFDTIIGFDWTLNRWFQIAQSGQFMATLSTPGLTLEDLDLVAPGQIAITNMTNSGGFFALTVASIARVSGPAGSDGTPAETQLEVGDYMTISGATGSGGLPAAINVENVKITNITGTGPYTIVTNVAFVGTYASGGTIAGSVDALTFSLDSVSTASLAQLSACDANNCIGLFNGPAMAATMETGDADLMGRRTKILGIRPKTDATAVMGAIGSRANAQTAAVYGIPQPINIVGICPVRIDTRYARAQLTMPAGAVWTYAKGVEPVAQLSGTR